MQIRPNIDKLREQMKEDFEVIEAFNPATDELIEVETIIADKDTLSRLLDYIEELEQSQKQLKAALEEIASDIDPKQTWTYVAVQRRLIARNALDKLKSDSV